MEIGGHRAPGGLGGLGLDNIGGPKGSMEGGRTGSVPGRPDSGLGGREVGVGHGTTRSEAPSLFARIKDTFQRTFMIGDYSPSKVFARENPYVSSLGIPKQGGLGANDEVIAKLVDHAKAMGSPLSPEQVRQLVSTGERLFDAINEAPPGGTNGPLTITGGDGQTHQVSSSVHTTRAIAWAMMAQAAARDIAQGGQEGKTSHMVTSGTIVMKDPGHKLYDFLNSAPTCTGRISTHFRERAMDDAPRDKVGHPIQRGVEDFEKMLPGLGGTLLFDKMKPAEHGGTDRTTPEIFFKIEGEGMPSTTKCSESHETKGRKFLNAFAAIGRCIAHTFSFIATRFDRPVPEGAKVSRMEHLYKGALKETVLEPFKSMLEARVTAGEMTKAEAKAMLNTAIRHGLEFVEAEARRVGGVTSGPGGEDLFDVPLEGGLTPAQTVARNLLESIAQERQRLGDTDRDFGIGRRGGEVFLSMQN